LGQLNPLSSVSLLSILQNIVVIVFFPVLSVLVLSFKIFFTAVLGGNKIWSKYSIYCLTVDFMRLDPEPPGPLEELKLSVSFTLIPYAAV
jgi:hypothetical protein